MATLINKIIKHLGEIQKYRNNTLIHDTIEGLKTSISGIIEEHEKSQIQEDNDTPLIPEHPIMSYEILTLEETLSLVLPPGRYKGINTSQGIRGFLNKMQVIKNTGGLPKHTFQQVYIDPDQGYLFIFKVID